MVRTQISIFLQTKALAIEEFLFLNSLQMDLSWEWISLYPGKSLIFSFFEGSHQDNRMFVSSLDESTGVLMEISDRFGSSRFISVWHDTDDSNLLGISSQGGLEVQKIL